MAERLQTLAAIVEEKYDGHAERLWTEATSGADLLKRVMELPGFGKQKAQIFTALLAKQLDVRPEGWEEAVGDYALEGYRSVADVADPASLQKVRDFKQQKKAAGEGGPGARPDAGRRHGRRSVQGDSPLRGSDQGHGRMTVRLLTIPGLAAPTMSLTRGVRVLDRA